MSVETARRIPQDLGLSPGQFFPREDRVIKNASWYDQNAHHVGSGDLSIHQPDEVAEHLENGELLAIVPSHRAGAFWSPTRVDRLLGRTDENPGLGFVAHNFALLIVPKCVYIAGVDGAHAYHQDYGDRPTLSPSIAMHLMKNAQQMSQVPSVAR